MRPLILHLTRWLVWHISGQKTPATVRPASITVVCGSAASDADL